MFYLDAMRAIRCLSDWRLIPHNLLSGTVRAILVLGKEVFLLNLIQFTFSNTLTYS